MKKVIVLITVLFLLSGVSAAQAEGERKVLINTVSVGADGKYEAAPDTAIVQFNVAAQADTSETAYDRAGKATDKVRQALRANGLDPKSAELAGYSLQPMYDWKSPKRKIIGYRVTNSASTKLHDFAKIGSLLTALSTIEDTENQSVSFILDDIDAAKQKAVEDAFAKAKTSALTVAKAGNRQLGDLVYASVDTYEQQPPVPMPKVMTMRAEAAGPAPTEEFAPGKITVTAHVNLLFNLK